MSKIDSSLFRASHWSEPKPSAFGDWCFTTDPSAYAGIEFEFNGTYTDAKRAALAALSHASTVYVMP